MGPMPPVMSTWLVAGAPVVTALPALTAVAVSQVVWSWTLITLVPVRLWTITTNWALMNSLGKLTQSVKNDEGLSPAKVKYFKSVMVLGCPGFRGGSGAEGLRGRRGGERLELSR